MAELRQPDKSIGPTLRTTARNREGHFPYFRAMSRRGVHRCSFPEGLEGSDGQRCTVRQGPQRSTLYESAVLSDGGR